MRTPLLRMPSLAGVSNLFVKDESTHATGTFKDRLASSALRRYPPGTTFGAISYGNTAISFVHAIRQAAQYGLFYRFIAFVPEGVPEWVLGPSSHGSQLSGAQLVQYLSKWATVIPIDLSHEILDDDDLLRRARQVDCDIDELVNVTEGIDEPAYVGVIEEAVDQLGFVPHCCLIPFGAGILCNEIIDFLDTDETCYIVPLSVADSDSSARMLYGPIWVDTAHLRQDGVAFSRHRSPDRTGRKRVPYLVRAVREEQVLLGLKRARELSLSAEPSGSVGLGILELLPNWIDGFEPQRHSVLVINTGNAIDAFPVISIEDSAR